MSALRCEAWVEQAGVLQEQGGVYGACTRTAGAEAVHRWVRPGRGVPAGTEGAAVNAREKGRILLAEGRLTVLKVGDEYDGLIQAVCRGDSAKVYDLGYDPRKREWRCTCEARGECSHLIALKLVTVQP